MSTLNCVIYDKQPTWSSIFSVEVDPGETVIVLRKRIWEEHPEWKNLNPFRLVLYTPKAPISASSETEFNDVLENLNLETLGGRKSALDKLNPTSDVGEYLMLREAARERLHVIVFLAAGRCR
jgi:hypothetical protein